MERLTADDHLFVVMEQVTGMPVLPQVIWRIGAAGNTEASGNTGAVLDHVADVGRHLRAGRLSRLVTRTRGPVRDRWTFTPEAGRVHVERDPLAPDAVTGWLDDRLTTGIDSVHGPAWELCARPTTDGDVVVSLVRSHVVADGAALISAVTEAVTGTQHAAGSRRAPGDTLRDALSLTRAAGRAAVGLLRGGSGAVPVASGAVPDAPVDMVGDGPAVVPTVAVRVDTARFDEVAAAVDGTSNTLFQAVTLGVLAGSGRVGEGDAVPVAVPMSVRGADGADSGVDLRANVTTGATVHTTVDPGLYRDLRPLREAAKVAYRQVGDRAEQGGLDRVAAMAQLAQVLPDTVVRRAAAGSSTPLCLASNLGEPDAAFARLGLDSGPDSGSTATCDVALRSVIRADSARELAARRGGISAWAVRNGDTLSLSFTSLDPVHVRDTEHLLDLVAGELDRWGLRWGSDVVRWL